MGKFDKYSYSGILTVLDNHYDHDTDSKNYALLLIGMKDCKSVKACLKLYKVVYEMITPVCEEFIQDLNRCLNENLLRLMKVKDQTLSFKLALSSLVNMRKCPNIEQYHKEWDNQCKIAHLDLEKPKEEIIGAQTLYLRNRNELNYYPADSNGYKRVEKKIKNNVKTLEKYGSQLILPNDFGYDKIEEKCYSLCWEAFYYSR